jgi:hypothetical protein
LRIQRLNELGELLFNGKLNYYFDLDDRTLGFENLLKDNYFKKSLNLDDVQNNLINEFRLKGNLIHLPSTGEYIQSSFHQELGENYLPFTVNTFNELVVDIYNKHSSYLKLNKITI